MNNKPVIKQDPLYQLLRTEDIKGFNEQRDRLRRAIVRDRVATDRVRVSDRVVYAPLVIDNN